MTIAQNWAVVFNNFVVNSDNQYITSAENSVCVNNQIDTYFLI